MRCSSYLGLGMAAFVLVGVSPVRDAQACGGCFVQQTESTQVSGHRMVYSVSKTATTLWDQITYTGAPESFAWVLPIKDKVEVGLSSDALFGTLEALTQVTVVSPQITCPPPPDCGGRSKGATGAAPNGAAGEDEEGGVEVIAQEVVGPYETVQLKADDPAALKEWLLSHGYEIPGDVAPVIDAYVGEGFGFLALKLVPGEGIDSMRPVRVTSPGAAAVLPLRMVAAGTGAITAVTLWVLGEGRYEPTTFPTFLVDEDDLVWSWDTQSSNYKELVQAGFAAAFGETWLVEAAEPVSPYSIDSPLESLVQYDPSQSGYTAEDGKTALDALHGDLEKLYGGMDTGQLAITRLHGELPREALATDMPLQAAPEQALVQRYFEAKQTVGTAPACPEQPPCDEEPFGDGSGDSGGGVWDGIWGRGQRTEDPTRGGGGGCSASDAGGSGALAGLVVVLGAALATRRGTRRSG